MADQWFRAWAVDLDAFYSIDAKSIPKITRKSQNVDDVRGMVEHDGITVEMLLADVVSGKLVKDRAYKYRRIAELVLDRVAKKLTPEATKPGRGWQSLAPAWKHWKLPAIAEAWTAVSPWPWKKPTKVDWPRLLVVTKLRPLAKDLAAFDPEIVVEKAVPKRVPRFGEGEWPMEDLAGELEHLVDAMRSWVATAQREKLALAIWQDGGS